MALVMYGCQVVMVEWSSSAGWSSGGIPGCPIAPTSSPGSGSQASCSGERAGGSWYLLASERSERDTIRGVQIRADADSVFCLRGATTVAKVKLFSTWTRSTVSFYSM